MRYEGECPLSVVENYAPKERRELELIHRAEAAERAVIEAVRQRDLLRYALSTVVDYGEFTDVLLAQARAALKEAQP